MAELAARYKEEGMLAYVNLVQKKEKEIGCDVLTHQKWFVSLLLLLLACIDDLFTGVVPTT
jgi:isocitrate lyase